MGYSLLHSCVIIAIFLFACILNIFSHKLRLFFFSELYIFTVLHLLLLTPSIFFVISEISVLVIKKGHTKHSVGAKDTFDS